MTQRGEQRLLILWGIAMLLGSILLLWVLYLIRNVLLAVYISTLLAIGFSPAVRWLEKQHFVGRHKGGLPRWAAILVLYVGFLAGFVVLMGIVVPPLVAQTTALWSELPTYVAHVQDFLVRKGLVAPGTDLMKELPGPSVAVESVLGVLQNMLGALGAVITILLLPYYLLVDADSLQAGLVQLVSTSQRPALARVTQDVAVRVGAWLNGQLLICVLIGTMTATALWLLKVPFFYVLGLMAGLGELVPIIGPLVAATPAILIAFTVSVETGLFTMAYFSVQQFLEGSVLVPRVMERQVGVSAIVVIIALLVGSELLGVVGALLAVPTAAIVQVMMQEFLSRERA
jgi:predicted PurR-regulated permease PerM